MGPRGCALIVSDPLMMAELLAAELAGLEARMDELAQKHGRALQQVYALDLVSSRLKEGIRWRHGRISLYRRHQFELLRRVRRVYRHYCARCQDQMVEIDIEISMVEIQLEQAGAEAPPRLAYL